MRHESKILQSVSTCATWGAVNCLAFLLLVFGAEAQPSAGVDWRYTIRPQDTVSELTRLYLKPSVSWQTLATYNRLPDANVINAGTQLRMPLRWLAVKQAHAKLITISGDVQMQSLEGGWHQAQISESMQTGQSIKVGRNSSARLQFADSSELVIQPLSTVTMDTLSVYAGGFMADTQVRLQSGRVEVHANPQGRTGQKFDVITPAAVATVRGTKFVVEAEGIRTLEQTTEGQVALETSQGIVLVQEGYASAAKVGEKPQAPEAIKAAPKLQNETSKFSDFPIAFALVNQPEVTSWTLQVGRDPKMAELVMNRQSTSPFLDAGALPDGNYYLRAWSLDAHGMPSQTLVHPFDVAIKRTQQGPAVQLPSDYFSNGPVTLQLPQLSPGLRYLLKITQDAQGLQAIWHMTEATPSMSIPVPVEQSRTYFLWIWAY
jgi:hypothetical protein